MAKSILYFPKQTAARTEYREIDPEDMAWLQKEFIRWLAVMSERDLNPSEDNIWILTQFWHKRTEKLHKGTVNGKYRQNTPCSIVGGLVNNLVFGNQRDLTDKQMSDIEFISMALATFLEVEPIRFQIRII
jgi:hypothetical protein